MSPIKTTIIVIIAVTLLLIGYDIAVYTNSVDNSLDTLSGRMRLWGMTTPLLPFAWGVLGGHFWGSFHAGQFIPSKAGIALLVFVAWSVIVAGIIAKNENIHISPWMMLIPGIIVGAVLWPQ